MTKIVTRESIQKLIDDHETDQRFLSTLIGRALVVLFEHQTNIEQARNATSVYNNVGFTGYDARSGTLTAKYFLAKKSLEKWQIDRWIKRGKSGFSRITKYHKQLNEAAMRKRDAENA